MVPNLPVENLLSFQKTRSHHLILELEKLYIPYQPHNPEDKLGTQKRLRKKKKTKNKTKQNNHLKSQQPHQNDPDSLSHIPQSQAARPP
jgi:hypothetical protein